jgi:hypothetical protein
MSLGKDQSLSLYLTKILELRLYTLLRNSNLTLKKYLLSKATTKINTYYMY